MSSKLNSLATLLVCVLLASATMAVYWPVIGYEFNNFDDPEYVAENAIVQKGLTTAGLAWAFTNGFVCLWQPLTWLSHMLDCELFGLNAGAHHLVNVLFHLANTLLLFFLLTRMTGAFWRSAFVAGLFALHPLRVESVAWVAERKDLLSTLFWMLTLWAYLRYVEQPKVARYLIVLLFFSVGLMAKPMLVTLPFVLLLLDYWPLGRWALVSPFHIGAKAEHKEANSLHRSISGTLGTERAFPSFARLILEKLPLFVLSLVASMITFFVAKTNAQTMNEFPLGVRVGNALISYVRYLGKMIWPTDLAVLYPHPGEWPLWQVAGAALILIVITWLAVASFRQRPYLAVGWLWYLGTLVPVIGLVQVGAQSMADRFTYVPLIGLFLLLTWGANDLIAAWPRRRQVAAVAAVAVLGGCMVGTWLQVRHWQNSVTLFWHALAVTTNNATAHYNLGQALSVQGKLKEPMFHYQEALRIKPDYEAAHNNMGLTLVRMGNFSDGTNHFAAALRINPGNAVAHFNFGVALASLGNLEEAIAYYTNALRLAPDDYMTHDWLGRALRAQNKIEEAMFHFRKALSLKPDYAEAHYDLGMAFTRQGKPEQAIQHLSEAVRLKPGMAEARSQLGLVLFSQDKPKEAIAQYREALRLKPDLVETLNNLAWLLATHPKPEFRNGTEAILFAQRACELTSYKLAPVVGTLAAAYAEAGQFPQAVETARKAHDLAVTANQSQIASRNRELLQLYQAGKPYREPH